MVIIIIIWLTAVTDAVWFNNVCQNP